jgi:uncharacterized membrane protein YbhN (UPF0104 family)
VTAVLAYVVADRRQEFGTALQAAPLWILLVATALQLLALLSRTESWRICIAAAGGTVGRRCLYRAASLGYLGSQLNSQVGTAARIGALRRAAPDECPRVPALVAAEVPIVAIEAALAALASSPSSARWACPGGCRSCCWRWPSCWLPGCANVACRWREGVWSGLAVLLSAQGRSGIIALVLVAVFAQIGRNWLMLHAVGVEASVFDATAVLIAMVTLSQLPVGPSVGAAAVVLILGAGGAAPAAAAGVLLTATCTLGALAYAGSAGIDRLWMLRPAGHRRASPSRPHVHPPAEPQPAIGAAR